MRFERKYRIDVLSLDEVKQVLSFHPVSFREHHPDRSINNIYFDTPDLATYHENQAGVGHRKKYRVRWYGNKPGEVHKPKFEIKIKKNELGEKQTFKMEAFKLEKLVPLIDQVNTTNPDGLWIQPVLLNSYQRSYLISDDGRFRATLDYNMRYHSMLSGGAFEVYRYSDPAIILEIKYESNEDEDLNMLTQHLPFRQTKHSKYITGVDMTC